MEVNMSSSWKHRLHQEFQKEYFKNLTEYVKSEYKKNVCYPTVGFIFAALNRCAFENVKVVIIGQDPYHAPGQANGLCFSVNDGVRIPPSLVNIFKEIETDLGVPRPMSGNLERWAAQGVLLLNATLTVRSDEAGSHQKKGWEEFTDSIIAHLNSERENLVFMLWGSYAQKKGSVIDTARHLVLRSVHPSPLSAYNGFFGCKHFSEANEYLREHGGVEVHWQ